MACTYTPALPVVAGASGADARPDATARADRGVESGAVTSPDAAPRAPDARPPMVPDAAPPVTPDAAAPDAPPGCQPVAEVCNGADDDCDGVADDGCPIDGALLVTGQRRPPGPVLGSLTLPRAVGFTDACPDGQAIIAFTGNYGSGIDALGVRCGKLQVREDRSVRPFRYELVIAPGQEFSPRGGTGGLVNGVDPRMRCPLNEVAVGLSAWLDPKAPATCPMDYCPFTGVLCASVYGLTVSCAAHELTGSPGNFRLSRAGAAHIVSERIGAVGGVGEVENPYACPSQGVLQEMKGAFGLWPLDCGSTVINGMQLTCSNPTVPMIPPP
jgi:hypothetical protein